MTTRKDALDALAVKHRSEEHTSELQSQSNLVCRLLLEKKNKPVLSQVGLIHGPTEIPADLSQDLSDAQHDPYRKHLHHHISQPPILLLLEHSHLHAHSP